MLDFRTSEKLKDWLISQKGPSLKVYKCSTPHLVNNFIWKVLSVMINGGSGTSQTGNYQVVAKYFCEIRKVSSHSLDTTTEKVYRHLMCRMFAFKSFPFRLYRIGYEIEISLLYVDINLIYKNYFCSSLFPFIVSILNILSEENKISHRRSLHISSSQTELSCPDARCLQNTTQWKP